MSSPELHSTLLWDPSGPVLVLTSAYFLLITFVSFRLWNSKVIPEPFVNIMDSREPLNNEMNDPWEVFGKLNHKSNLKFQDSYFGYGKGKNNGKIAPENEIDVDCDPCIDPIVKNQIREILESHVVGQGDGEWNFCNEEDILDLGELTLPTVKYYSKYEGKRVKLLHSIAELGDMREVSRLQRMLELESNESIAILIKEIIIKLLSESPEDGEKHLPKDI